MIPFINKISLFLAFIMLVSLCSACTRDSIIVKYDGNKAEVISNVEGIKIKVKGSNVTVNDSLANNPISIRLTGTSDDGQFTLKSKSNTIVRLDGLNLISQEGAPIVLKSKELTTIEVLPMTDNSLTIEACVDTAKHKAAVVWAKGDVEFKGSGTLKVLAKGDGCKGINVKKDLAISDLDLTVATEGNYLCVDTTQHGFPGMPQGFDGKFPGMDGNGGFPMGPPPGMKGNFPKMPEGMDFPKMPDGKDIPNAPHGMPPFGGEGFLEFKEGENPFGGGGFPGMQEYIGTTKGIKVGGKLTITSGKINVTTTSPGAEGIEGKKSVVINDGEVYIKSNDDAINSNGEIYLLGGKVTAWSTNNDAIDSNAGGDFFAMMPFFGDENGSGNDGKDKAKDNRKEQKPAIYINGGEIYAWSQNGPPEEGFDCDFSPIAVNGGTAFSIGAGMGDMPSVPTNATATQPTVLLIGTEIVEGEQVTLLDSDNNELLSFKAPFNFNRSSSLVTSPKFKVGNSYKLKCGDKTYDIKITENFTTIRQ